MALLTLIRMPRDGPMTPGESWGRVFRCHMPFRAGGELEEAVAEGVSTIVMLTSDAEAGQKVGRDLAAEYHARGLERIHLPIVDFSTPDATDLVPAVRAAATRVRGEKTILVHCSAGIGRTGMFLACLLRELTGVDARVAIEHVRGFVAGAVETPDQVRALSKASPLPPSSREESRQLISQRIFPDS